MVAPTRFAAGVPIKVYDAASYGVPVVMTDLLADQLGWKHDGIAAAPAVPDLMAAAVKELALNPDAWHRCQSLQAKLVSEDCNPAAFETLIHDIIADPLAATHVICAPASRNTKKERKRHGS